MRVPALPTIVLLLTPAAGQLYLYRGPGELFDRSFDPPPPVRGPGPVPPPFPLQNPKPPGPGPGPGPWPGIPLGPDLTRWNFWWEFNRHDLVPRQAPPLEASVRRGVRQALRKTLRGTDDVGVMRAAMIALARSARAGDVDDTALFVSHLKSDPRTASVAAMALGISQRPAAVTPLLHLVQNTRKGARSVGARRVRLRLRVAAIYGLGLHGPRGLAALRGVFLEPGTRNTYERRYLKVAAVHGLAMIGAASAERDEVVRTLRAFESTIPEKQRRSSLVAPHLPVAIARLLGRGRTALHQEYKYALLERLGEPRRKLGQRWNESLVMALGHLALPAEEHEADAKVSEALQRAVTRVRFSQARNMAMLALGRIGGAGNREFLLEKLTRGNKALGRPWAALALAAFGNGGEGLDAVLLDQLRRVKNPDARSAFAIALGMRKHQPAAAQLSEYLLKYRAQDQFGGCLATSLGMLGSAAEHEELTEYTRGLTRRPDAAMRGRPALARLDPSGARSIVTDQMRWRMSLNGVAEAIGEMWSASDVRILIRKLDDKTITDAARAEIVAGLGRLAEHAAVPWHARMTAGLNYRALGKLQVGRGQGLFEIF